MNQALVIEACTLHPEPPGIDEMLFGALHDCRAAAKKNGNSADHGEQNEAHLLAPQLNSPH